MSNKGDDYIRPPDKSTKMTLVDESPNAIFENDEDFLRYKFLITHNTKIPHEMKSAMIASKRDEMVRMRGLGHVFSGGTFNPFDDFHHTENQYANSKAHSHGYGNNANQVNDDIDDITFQQPVSTQPSTMTLTRGDAYNALLELIFAYYDEFNSYCNVEGLVLSIQQYLDNIINEIILQSDVCWGIRQNIELLCQEDIETKKQLKKIFVPDSIDDYERFVEMIGVQKQSNEINDLEEINKQIQLQHELEEHEKIKQLVEEEEQKNKRCEIEKRTTLMNSLFQQLTRLGSYDNSIKELKILITPTIEQYIALETDYVVLTQELYDQIVKFVKQIRLDSTTKEELITAFKY